MKKVFVIIIIVLFAFCVPCVALCDDNDPMQQIEEETQRQIEHIEWEELENFLRNLDSGNMLSGGFLETVKSILNGEMTVNEQQYGVFLADLVLGGIKSLIPSIISIIALSILLGVFVKNNSLLGGSINEIVHLVCYVIVIISVLIPTWSLIEQARSTIGNVKELSNLLMPVLITVMSITGARAGVGAVQPGVALLSGGVIELIGNCVLPMVVLGIVFCAVSNMSNSIKLNKLSDFFRSTSSVLLGLVFTVFTAFLTVKGISANTADGISLRAVKFATRSYVPILGGYLAEGLDLVLASGILLKNAIGVCGLIILLLTISAPVVKIILYSLAMKLTSAVIQPLTDNRIVDFLSECSKCLTVLYVSIIAVAFMFFMLCMMVVGTANSL